MATAIITSLEQQLDNSGVPLNGGTITVYQPTTTTLVSLFSDTALSVGVSNPITLDSAGRHAMTYMANGSYKLVCKNSGGTTLWTRDSIDPGIPIGSGALAIANGGTAATSAAAALSNLGGISQAQLDATNAAVSQLAGTLSATDKTHIATGTTAQRSSSPIEGDIRRNTTKSQFEGYNGAAHVPFITASADISSTAPTVQRFASGSGATYTTPTGAVRLRVRMVGPGGGGGAAVTNAGAAGSADTAFGTWTAVKGSGGPSGTAATIGGAGGTGGTDGTGTKIRRVDGARGSGSAAGGTVAGPGGSSALGGAGAGLKGGVGGAAATNSGSGGAGGDNSGTTSGGGGGAGEYVEFWITAPAATYSYTVGSGGAGAAAGTVAGGNGAAGVIEVEEFYY